MIEPIKEKNLAAVALGRLGAGKAKTLTEAQRATLAARMALVAANRIAKQQAETRLEYLRGELRGERISYGELAELQDLVPFIQAGDVELLEAAGVPENK